MITTIHTRRFGIRDILKVGFQIWGMKPLLFLSFALLMFLPNFLLKEFAPLEDLQQSLGDFGYMLFSQVLIFLFSLFNLLPGIAIAHIVECAVQSRPVTWVSAIRFATSRWGIAVLTYLLMKIMLLGLAFLLIIPAAIWSIYYGFMINAIANRNLAYRAALDYSKDLVKGRWWGVYATIMALVGAIFVPAIIIGLLLSRVLYNPLFSIVYEFIIQMSISILLVMFSVWFLNLDYLKHPIEEAASDSGENSLTNVPESVFF